MANIFRQPLIMIQGTGVTITPNNLELIGKTSPTEIITIEIGNDISPTANPIFFTLTSTIEQFQINDYIIKPNALTGSISILGNTTVSSLTTLDN